MTAYPASMSIGDQPGTVTGGRREGTCWGRSREEAVGGADFGEINYSNVYNCKETRSLNKGGIGEKKAICVISWLGQIRQINKFGLRGFIKNVIIKKFGFRYNNTIRIAIKQGTDEKGNWKMWLLSPTGTNIQISQWGNLRKAKFFTTLGLESSCHQIILAERNREEISFSLKRGKYQFKRPSFGLKNSSSVVPRTLDDIL